MTMPVEIGHRYHRQSRDQVYPVAELRLRCALIPLLVGGNTIPVQSFFEC
jgi:hypothetical protein